MILFFYTDSLSPIAYYLLYLALWVSMGGLFWASEKSTPAKAIIRLIFIAGVLCRLVLIYVDPIFEDDHFRYLVDGFMFLDRGTPYEVAPIGPIGLHQFTEIA